MLEFPENYFKQEVREGFYIDTTMKTVWAAALELLQKVAEICDRHGFAWYAAYGTLMGAIRHEGFVPWDDDMDIWVMRKDYDKLMRILQLELPEGYYVRSALNENGYDQFHSVVCTGKEISIAKEWLEQFHGCPFTVMIDIFPLDCLPRDEGEREIVETMLTIAGRMAQLAKEIEKGSFDDEPEKLQNTKEEIKEGIKYLTEEHKLPINACLADEEKWFEFSSEMWKWANVIASSYGEEDGDYLVEWLDYTRWKHKKFPKEWFAETYGADFEGFMLPVPSGYDQALTIIYGDYWHYARGGTQHDYPYYKKQLEYLRTMTKAAEASTDNAEVGSDGSGKASDEMPKDWLALTLREDGAKKKIVLSANDPFVYLEQKDKALDKLENTLAYFEGIKDSVTLWWRPHPVMKKLLANESAELCERYERILDKYKAAGWGICDETDNTERAVEMCGAYYGEMNAILQPFQNAGRPIMLAVPEDENTTANNEARLLETRSFISFTDFVEYGDKLYFSNNNFNALTVVNKKNWIVEECIPFEGEALTAKNLHLKCVETKGKICFLPVGAGCAHIYDIESREQRRYELAEKNDDMPKVTWDYCICGEKVYLLPAGAEQKLWIWDAEHGTIEAEEWWKSEITDVILRHSCISEKCFATLQSDSNRLYITNVQNKTVEEFLLPDKNVYRIAYDGQDFWYTVKDNSDVVCWNIRRGEVKRYCLYLDDYYSNLGSSYYLGVHCSNGKVFLVPQNGKKLYLLDKEKGKSNCVCDVELSEHFTTVEKIPYFKQIDGNLIYMPRNADEGLVINLKHLNLKKSLRICNISMTAEKYRNIVFLRHNPLLFEEKGKFEVDILWSDLPEKQ